MGRESAAGRVCQVLVVAEDEATRRSIASGLGSGMKVRLVAPAALQDVASLVDVPVAVALLDGDTALETLLPLRDLPVASHLVLLFRDVAESALEDAMTRLAPAAALPYPVPTAALRWAARRAAPRPGAAQGERPPQRRTPALLGVSSAVRDVMERIRRIGPTPMPVLILGETGTGKELVARAIHGESAGASRRFVAVNCGALPDTLLEAELFGFKRGAFTGAERNRTGLFEQADGGTLFLDEIGDTSAAFQAKLLRALEAQEIRPLGTNEVVHVSVRIVSATHHDLEEAVKQGDFRQDLFYRLNTVTIHLPPLRRRRVDIAFLAQHFAEEFGEAQARRIVLDEDFLEAVGRHDFPGNVRELRNAVERAIALAHPEERVGAGHLESVPGEWGLPALPAEGTLRERVQNLEIELIRGELDRQGGNRTRTAEALGLSRLGLRKKMRRYGLD